MRRCNNFVKVVFVTLLLLVSVIVLKPLTVKAQSDKEVDKKVEDAILAEDWKKAADLLGSVDTETPSPVLRLIKGHACLALNRNNESLCLFLSVSSEDELKVWEKWTQDFAGINNKSAVAYYFRGDALGRLEQWDKALVLFNKTLELQPRHAMTLNARGVNYAAQQKFNEALLDFDAAIKANPFLADAYASRGSMYIQKKAGAEGALRWFNHALEKSPSFALARYGRGYMKVVLGKSEEGPKEIQEASRDIACMNDIVKEDLKKVAEWVSIKDNVEVTQLTAEDVGTQLDKIITDIGKTGNVGNLNQAARILGKNPEYSQGFMNKLNDLAKARPDLAPKIGDKIVSGKNWTSDTGGGMGWINTLKGFNFGGTAGKKGNVTGGLGFGDLANQHINKTQFDNKGWGNMKDNFNFKSFNLDPHGGVTSSLAGARVDEGDWPFDAHYGLLYNIDSRNIAK